MYMLLNINLGSQKLSLASDRVHLLQGATSNIENNDACIGLHWIILIEKLTTTIIELIKIV